MRPLLVVMTLALFWYSVSTPVAPTERSGRSTGIASVVGGIVAVYRVTFTASTTCASTLEPEARQRRFTATFRSGGTIDWSGPTLKLPAGRRTISSGVLSNDGISFSIDGEGALQPGDFHGLWDWDDFGGGKFLHISGTGIGVLHQEEITGEFNGVFAFHDPFDHYCRAMDHQFRFVKQQPAVREWEPAPDR